MLLRAPGVRVRPLGVAWVAFSALSRETHLLNDEAVAVLDALHETTARTQDQVAEALSVNYSTPASDLLLLLEPVWESLIGSGLVRRAGS
jgi:hypothetical protein